MKHLGNVIYFVTSRYLPGVSRRRAMQLSSTEHQIKRSWIHCSWYCKLFLVLYWKIHETIYINLGHFYPSVWVEGSELKTDSFRTTILVLKRSCSVYVFSLWFLKRSEPVYWFSNSTFCFKVLILIDHKKGTNICSQRIAKFYLFFGRTTTGSKWAENTPGSLLSRSPLGSHHVRSWYSISIAVRSPHCIRDLSRPVKAFSSLL